MYVTCIIYIFVHIYIHICVTITKKTDFEKEQGGYKGGIGGKKEREEII